MARAREILNQATQNVEQQQAEAERLGWINELFDELDPREGQWEELSKEHSLLSNGAEIVSHIRAAADALSQGDVTAVGLTMQAQADLSAAAKFDPELAQSKSLYQKQALFSKTFRATFHTTSIVSTSTNHACQKSTNVFRCTGSSRANCTALPKIFCVPPGSQGAT